MSSSPCLQRALLPVGVAVVTLLAGSTARAQDQSFAYVGYLDRDGQAVNEVCDFKVYLHANPASAAIWEQARPDIQVNAGQFSFVIGPVPAAQLASRALWVGIEVKKDSDPDEPASWVALQGKQQLTSTLSAAHGTPAGTIVAFGGAAAPAGWLPCDGTARRSADYPALHAAVGTRWGNGTTGTCSGGSCNFNLPDLRGRFLRGDDASAGRDPGSRASAATGGASSGVGTVQDEAYLGHSHGIGTYALSTDGAHSHSYTSPLDGEIAGLNHDSNGTAVEWPHTNHATTTSDGDHSHTLSGSSASAGGNETRPDNAAVLYIIKY